MDDKQLGGKGGTSSSCSPQQYVNGSANPGLPNNGEINPCGLIAWSFFNDTFSVSRQSSGNSAPVSVDVRFTLSFQPSNPRVNQLIFKSCWLLYAMAVIEVLHCMAKCPVYGESVSLLACLREQRKCSRCGCDVPQESGIAWSYDKNHLYGSTQPVNYNIYPELRGGNTSEVPVNQNEHLMVWLRPAAQPSFRKNWGRIDQQLPAGKTPTCSSQKGMDMYSCFQPI